LLNKNKKFAIMKDNMTTQTRPNIKEGDTVEYIMGTERVTATVIDIFENGDIRTDRDGVRTRYEYTIINM
jgi:hypothetical protein